MWCGLIQIRNMMMGCLRKFLQRVPFCEDVSRDSSLSLFVYLFLLRSVSLNRSSYRDDLLFEGL